MCRLCHTVDHLLCISLLICYSNERTASDHRVWFFTITGRSIRMVFPLLTPSSCSSASCPTRPLKLLISGRLPTKTTTLKSGSRSTVSLPCWIFLPWAVHSLKSYFSDLYKKTKVLVAKLQDILLEIQLDFFVVSLGALTLKTAPCSNHVHAHNHRNCPNPSKPSLYPSLYPALSASMCSL